MKHLLTIGEKQMVRMIDADALNTYDISPCDGFTVIGVTEEDLHLAPTVDAIPVEWIEEYMNNHMCKFSDRWMAMDWMLNDWRKENGQTD